ncbi:hypothetical protein F5Y19DRAFT_52686 [Xylariaceae sp. FL1651]|nr:hypothetical protein F5Y19DRAFT_52686 [Xylariaceae sp. FL1651]
MAPKTKKKGPQPSPATPGTGGPKKKGTKPPHADEASSSQLSHTQQYGAGLPSLFPTHDGSYGINTLINLDGEPKKGYKPNTDIAKEQLDDKKWGKYIKAKVGKKYGMDSDLKKAIDEGHQEVDKEHQVPASAAPPLSPSNYNPSSPLDLPNFPPVSDPLDKGPTNPPNPPGPLLDPDYVPPPPPYIPRYKLNNAPFLEDYSDQPRPPYTRAELPSLNSHAIVGVNQPAAPPLESISFYGMPQGAGTDQPISPSRPESSRSFNFESSLFSNATLQTPSQLPGPFNAHPAKAQTAGALSHSQPTELPGSKGLLAPKEQPASKEDSTPGGQPASEVQPASQVQPASEMQPAFEVQPAPSEQSVSGVQPAPSEQSVSGVQPAPSEQSVSGVRPAPSGQSAPGGQLAADGLFSSQGKGFAPTMKQSSTANRSSTAKQGSTVQPYAQEKATQFSSINNNMQPIYKAQSTSSNTAQPSGTSVTQPNPAPSGRRAGRQREWGCPSSDTIITWVVMFSVVAVLIGAFLPAISDSLSDFNPQVPLAGFGFPNIKIGMPKWGTFSGTLPGHTDIYGSPSIPSSSGGTTIDYSKLAKELEGNMPNAIWVQKDKKGQLKIPEDFWHALKELIKKDDIILVLENAKNQPPEISSDHWEAVKSRIEGSSLGTGKRSDGEHALTQNIEKLVKNTMSESWETWLNQNEYALRKAVTGVALTKDDFMGLFKEEISSYQNEIRNKFSEFHGRIDDITQQMSKLQQGLASAGGMTKHEIKVLVDSLVSKAISNVKFDAVAQGRMSGHNKDLLFNQVNFFGIGAGATIDPTYSSRAWQVPNNFFKTKKWLENSYKAQPRMAALSPWNQEGECFCAGPDLKGYGHGTNNISVIISRDIIPQHLVVEHILPGSTLDPGAMPKEIEFWAYIEELNLRNEVQTFSQTHFPNTPKEVILNEGWIKIGHFTYENNNHGDGIQVFKMSDQLATMNAATNQVVVRAINNYGADHTCFYRLRLFGEVVERPDDPPDLHQKSGWF